MQDWYLIYIERLRRTSEKKTFEVSKDFLPKDDHWVQFEGPVHIDCEAYLAKDALVCKIQAFCHVRSPCSICNEVCKEKLEIEPIFHVEELANISHCVFNFKDLLRDAFVLGLPNRLECMGDCPNRDQIAPYIRKKQ